MNREDIKVSFHGNFIGEKNAKRNLKNIEYVIFVENK